MKQIAAGCIAATILVLALSQDVHADLMLSLSSPNDLSNLAVGDTVTVEARISGLTGGDELEALTATTSLDPTVFGLPALPVAGPIVPDVTDFIAVVSEGKADGAFFLSTESNGLSSDGVFYQFSVKVLGIGSGVIAFEDGSLSAEMVGLGTPVFPAATSGLTYHVVPEPATAATLSLIAMIGIPFRKVRCNHLS